MFVIWVRHNIPSREDLKWLAKGGGMVGGGHLCAQVQRRAEADFLGVVLGGLSLSLSGLS